MAACLLALFAATPVTASLARAAMVMALAASPAPAAAATVTALAPAIPSKKSAELAACLLVASAATTANTA